MNGTWYNGTATFLNKGVGPGGWANITIWAYNATGNGNTSVGSVSDSVQAPAMVDPPDDNPCTIMHPDSETRRKWIESYNAAPKVNISRDGVMALPDEHSVLGRLDYNATERYQGVCGNCWVWAGTGCMEVAHDVENGVFDRLSIQYLNSLYHDGTGNGYACCGGWLSDLVDFYLVNTTIAVPWDNTNASWQDGAACCCEEYGCSPPNDETTASAASIATMPHYTITHIEARTITTRNIGQTAAIDNIKSVLANDNAIWFGFFLSNNSDWAVFMDFWNNDTETDLWSPDYSCGHPWNPAEGGGHAVLCVGYNNSPDIEPYWIMLNSWGNSTNRSNGLFRMNMDINYNCSDAGGDPNLYWQMLDIDFADICVNETGWWRHGSEFHGSETPIQAAVDAANQGETIHVAAGIYDENVDIETSHLTLVGEGADVVNVRAALPSDPVFEVTADYVNISGFNVTGAQGDAGIYLCGADYCNISDNNASGNYRGIYLYPSSNNNTLTGNTASGNGYGIQLHSSSNNNTLTGNTASGNDRVGIYLSSSSNNTLTSNTANSNTNYGIYLYSSSNNTLTSNTANSNTNYGIYLSSSSNNTLANNTMSGNDYNFGVYAGSLSDYTQNIDMSNTVDGKPIYYWVDQQGEQIPTDAGYVGVVSSTNIIVRDLNLAKNLQGILFVNTSNSTIENVTASNNNYGIHLYYSSNNNTLTGNTASGNGYGIMLGVEGAMAEGANNTTSNNFGRRSPVSSNDTSGKGYGIMLGVGEEMAEGANNNILTDNTANSNNWYGIWLYDSNNNTLTSNTANSNSAAPDLPARSSSNGIYLRDSSSNTLTNNNASNDDYGIYLRDSSSNTLTNNTVTSNNYHGIYLSSSSSSNMLNSNTADSNTKDGIRLETSSNNALTSNTANNNGWNGIRMYDSSNNNTLTSNNADTNGNGICLEYLSNYNTLTDNTASDNSDWDIRIQSSSSTFADNTLNGTTVSFTYSGDVSLKGVGLPAAGAPWYSIGKFIDVTNQSEGAWMFLNFSYSDSDFTGAMDESNLTVWKYNGTWYEDGWNGTRYSDPANNTVGVNITSFSIFAPMTTGVPALDHITVEPRSALLNIDEPPKSQIFTATGRSKHTDPIPDLMFGWSNTDTSVGWLNKSTGTLVNFTAERAGRAYLTASNGSVTSDQVPVTVDAIADNTTVDDEKIFTATSGSQLHQAMQP
jgi:parallel beta-helix repeat protein